MHMRVLRIAALEGYCRNHSTLAATNISLALWPLGISLVLCLTLLLTSRYQLNTTFQVTFAAVLLYLSITSASSISNISLFW